MMGDVYNLASGREISVRELALMAASAIGRQITPRFDGVAPQGDPLNWRADISRIAGLGFEPKIALEKGVGAYADWCRLQLMDA